MSPWWILPIVTWTLWGVFVVADKGWGEPIVESRFSRRFILPVWEQIKGGVRWVGEKVTR